MFPYIIVDIVIVLVLAFFAWRGAKKGLILTVFGLLGLVVAIFGARFISTTFYSPVADIIEPGICQTLEKVEREAIESIDLDFSADSSVEALVEVLRVKERFPGLMNILDSVLASDGIAQEGEHTAVETLSRYLAELLSRLGLFVLSFLVILLVWFLVSHVLDLTFHLPILSTINLLGGLILGLVKAVVIVVILVWFGQLMDWIPAQPTTPILALFTPGSIAELLNKLVV